MDVWVKDSPKYSHGGQLLAGSTRTITVNDPDLMMDVELVEQMLDDLEESGIDIHLEDYPRHGETGFYYGGQFGDSGAGEPAFGVRVQGARSEDLALSGLGIGLMRATEIGWVQDLEDAADGG